MRLDQRLVAEGWADSRARAQALIAAGAVEVAGAVITKPADRRPGAIRITADPNPWVSRAGLKLAHALDHFGLSVAGTALDLGASTGGFTQVLLARGAALVHALDVGHGQLHPALASDPRVVVHEGINARAIPPGLVGPVAWLTADLSFIPLGVALPGPLDLLQPGGHLVALIKPQFEAGPRAVGKGGIVRDPAAREAAANRVAGMLDSAGLEVLGRIDSPVPGADGNREFLIAARRMPRSGLDGR